jgi:hypothetical protein
VKYDGSCVLTAADHDWLKHDSYVYYKMATMFTQGELTSRIADGIYEPKARLGEPQIRAVLDGLHITRFASPWLLDFQY